MADPFADLKASAAEADPFADLKASAAQEAPPPSVMDRVKSAAGWMGKQLDRVGAAGRGFVQAFQEGDPRTQARNPAYMAYKGFTDPESVQSYEHLFENAGVPNNPTPRMYTNWDPKAGPLGQPIQGIEPNMRPNGVNDPSAMNPGLASGLGAVAGMFEPTGLEMLPTPLLKALGKGGEVAEDAGLRGIQGSLKPSKQLRNLPVPFNSENLLTPRPGAEDGLASVMGKKKTLENIQNFHDQLGDQQDQLLQNFPAVNLRGAVSQARNIVEDALARGGDQSLGISRRDADALRGEMDFWKKDAQDISNNGWVDGPTAKQYRGSLADAASYDQTASSNAKRVAAATVREVLNEQLSHLSPEFRQLDRQFAETIPLRNSIADALGREGNKYPIGLRASVVLATHGASLPAEAAKLALIEGTSHFAPQVAFAKSGRALSNLAQTPWANFPIPAIEAVKANYQAGQNIDPVSILQAAQAGGNR